MRAFPAPHSNLLVYPTGWTIFSIHIYNRSSSLLYPSSRAHITLQHICTIQPTNFTNSLHAADSNQQWTQFKQFATICFLPNWFIQAFPILQLIHMVPVKLPSLQRSFKIQAFAFVQSPGSRKIPGFILMLLFSWGVLARQAD